MVKMENMSKLFFVVDDEDTNEEIFEYYEQAVDYCNSLSGKNIRIRISIVRNYFKDKEDDWWNYEDLSDTFEFIKEISEK